MKNIKPTHSRIGASSYYRWSKIHGGCPASVRLSEGIESPESPYAKEGTLAHDIAAKILECHFFTQGDRHTIPHGVTSEMLDAIKVYVDFVKKEATTCRSLSDKGHILIEHKFELSSVHKDLYGTSDATIYDPHNKKLVVIDYKHGAGIAVEVENNLQLKYYGLGALLSTGFPCNEVELVIVQPRCSHKDGVVRKWKFKSLDLLDFAAELASDARATEDPNAEINPGEHCRFCPAAATHCPALREKSLAMAKEEFGGGLSYDPKKLDQALKFLPAMEAWIKNVREFAYNEVIHGRDIPGWKLVAKRGTRKWIVDEETIIGYMKKASKRDVSEFYEMKLKSPAQMEKLSSKQINMKLREFCETVSSGYNLVPESDPRKESKIDPASEFDKIEN